MNAEKLDRAIASLMLSHPYFGSIASALTYEVNDDIEAFRSDGAHFTYNDDYLKTLSLEEVEFTLANAAMHYALSHKNRLHQREGWLWQMATDYAINDMLIKNDLFPPDRIYYDARFSGMYAEEIYAILEEEIDEKELSDAEEKFQQAKKERADEVENESIDEEFLNMLHQKSKAQGDLPKDMKRHFPELFDSSFDWQRELHRYLNVHAKEDYAFFPPNKKYLHQGLCLPSLKSALLKIVVAIDTSGSIDTDALARFFAEFGAIMESFRSYEIDLIECDARVQNHRVFYPGDAITYETRGGGGTDFRPLFSYVDQYIPDAKIILYFTDGLGTFPTTAPSCDTLWVMTKASDVPFGEVLEI